MHNTRASVGWVGKREKDEANEFIHTEAGVKKFLKRTVWRSPSGGRDLYN